jgi:hypothetical protein
MSRQDLVNVRCGDGGVAGAYCDLVKVGDHVARGIDAVDGGALVFVNFETAGLASLGAKSDGQVGFHVAAKRWI